MFNNVFSLANVIPTDVKVFYENGTPYLEYRGVVNNCREQVEVYLPKIALNLSAITWETDESIIYNNARLVAEFANEFADKKDAPVVKTIERTMTKEQIEKELGYKIKIV